MPYLRLLGAQAAIGAAAIFARFALTGTGPLTAAALRLALAALPVAIVAWGSARVRLAARGEVALALAGVALALHFATWLTSLLYTSVAVSTLLVSTSPLWTALYDAASRRAKPAPRLGWALALAALGIVLVTVPGAASDPAGGRRAFGIVLALAGGIAIAAYLIIVRSAAAPRSGGAPVPTVAIVSRTYAWATVILAPFAVAAGRPPPALHDVVAWGGILAMAFVSQLLGHTGLNAALADFPPSTVALSTLLEPVIAAALAAAIFSQTLAGTTVAGGVLILCAIGIVLRTQPAPLQ
jgi:drug/metabolite transporter (DMT)-like permease